MRKYLLPKDGNFYKANLHSHSTVSDGKYTPKELKELYMAQGYSAIAYTDHNLMVAHSELTDENFVALTGWEFAASAHNQKALEYYGNDNLNAKRRYINNCDICVISPSPDDTVQHCYHRTKHIPAFMEPMRALVNYDENEPDFEREFTPESINEFIRIHKEKGYFVTFNHPGFSLADCTQFTQYRGLDAMEICNFGSCAGGHPDYNEKEYDQFLRSGQRLYCIATDDNHNYERYDPNRVCDSFGGFTMIKAEKLEYEALFTALKAGNMYASQGPLIYDLYLEDGKIYITCSDAQRVVLSTAGRRCAVAQHTDGTPINSASFEIAPEDGYVRITVTDFRGKHANTNAYFTDKLF